MKSWLYSWRAAVRIARRDAWRFKGRSLLVLAMIAVPIMGVSALDVTYRSSELSPSESLTRDLGAADARVSDPGMGGVALLQNPEGSNYQPVHENDTDAPSDEPAPADWRKALPADARVLSDTVGSATVGTRHGLLQTEVRELKATDPMTRGIFRLSQGRFPGKPDEVAVTTHFLESSALHVGSKLVVRGLNTPFRIVGAYKLPDALKANQVNALPGALLEPLSRTTAAAGQTDGRSTETHLVSVPGDFSWAMVEHANAQGVVVVSRSVTLNPPADADVPLYQRESPSDVGGGSSVTALALATTIVGMAMLEICLLAGAAFAVGARRSQRQLGLVGANGGDRGHIRTVVLAGGLVIGVAAAVVGTGLGIVLTLALRPTLENAVGQQFGSFRVSPEELLAIALLAVLTGLLAALVPAITASRQSVLTSLTGRRGVRHSNKKLSVLGLAAVSLGGLIALFGSTHSSSPILVAGGSCIAEIGVVAMTPTLVGLFGRIGRWLPLAPRLALRDAVRNRGRTAPAVAAVLAAVAGTVAVSTYVASLEAGQRADYRPALPYAAVSVTTSYTSQHDMPAVRTAVQRNLPITARADVDALTVGKATCTVYDDSPACGTYEVITPKANQCPLTAPGEDQKQRTPAENRRLARDWRCASSSVGSLGGPAAYAVDSVLVGNSDLLSVLKIHDPAAVAALARGKVVVLDKSYLSDGRVDIRRITDKAKAEEASEKNQEPPGPITSLPAYQVPGAPASYGISMIMTPAAAHSAGFLTTPLGAYFSETAPPSDAQRQKLNAALAQIGSQPTLYIEQGFTSSYGFIQLALTIFAGLITVGAAGVATGLAQADAEADLRTLAAVGAPSRVRRTLSGFQCAVVAAMGVLLGSVAGTLPATGLRLAERSRSEAAYQLGLDQGSLSGPAAHIPVVIPWDTVATLLIAVPLGAALLAALLTRSHKALGRRAVT